MITLSSLATVTAMKLAGIGGCSIGAFILHGTMPDQVFRRKLNHVFRMGRMYFQIEGYQKRKITIYPTIRKVKVLMNRIEGIITFPVGFDPAIINNQQYQIRQAFSPYDIELEMSNDYRSYTLRVFTSTPGIYHYDANEIDKEVKGIPLPIHVGRTHSKTIVYNMVDHPHLLIAGETGSGKSAALRSILTTLIRNCSDRLDLYCADMKMSEFHVFKKAVKQVVNDEKGVAEIVLYIKREMKRRGKLLDKEEVAHIDDLSAEKKPNYIIFAIDEFSEIESKRTMSEIIRIGRLGRALGVFVILSTQRPDSKVIDGSLKANMTVKMAFRQNNALNSRIVIDSGEAADIKQHEQGKMVLNLDGLRFVQGPLLEAEEAKSLLAPYTVQKPVSVTEILSDDVLEIEDVEEESNSIEFGVLDYE